MGLKKNIKKIAIIAQPEYFNFIYGTDLSEMYDVLYFPMQFYKDEKYFAELIKFNADVNIFFRGEFLPRGLLKYLRGINIAWSSEPFPRYINGKINYTTDSINRFITFYDISKRGFNYIFHYDESSRQFLEESGVYLSGYQCFSAAVDTYMPVSVNDYERDVLFIGRTTSHRSAFFSEIDDKYKFLNIVHGITEPSDLADFVSKSKICLNLHAENELSLGSRLQLLMSLGAVVISEPLPENDIFVPNQHYIEAKTPKELDEMVSVVLQDYDRYIELGVRARKLMEDKLAVTKVIPKLISNVLDGEYNPPVFTVDMTHIEREMVLDKYGCKRFLA